MRVRWRNIVSYFESREGFTIEPSGQSRIIAGPHVDGRMRDTVVIPSVCCHPDSAEVTKPYLRQIERVFGIKIDDILHA